jgi:adenylate cyclase
VAREQRRLAAILFADAIGSSRLMGRDESGTVVRLLDHLNRRLAPVAARCGGRVIRLTGDGGLVEFASAVDALRAAIEFQQSMVKANLGQTEEQAILFRIGLHLGDVIINGKDIYGDDVNVAARLETESPPGGIVISRAVHDAVRGRLKATFHPLGDLTLKNIARPIRAFRVEWSVEDWSPIAVASGASTEDAPIMLLDKPSIAVLPFQNISGDPEQEYFVDGLVEDIIIALCRFKSLFVIARDSSFTYKGRAIDIKQVGQELGVRYVLEGSVRRTIDRVRITGQLIECDTGMHLWADRFEGSLEDIFDLQDKVASDVVGAIAPKLERVEMERARRKPTESLNAYDTYLRGMSKFYLWRLDVADEAQQLFHRAAELDPGYAAAHAMAAHMNSHRKAWGMRLDSAKVAQTADLARRAVELAPDDAFVLSIAAWALGFAAGDLAAGISLVNQAVMFNSNLSVARFVSGWLNVWLAEPDAAIAHFVHTLKLSPIDPATGPIMIGIAHAHFISEHFDEALSWAEKAVHAHRSPPALRIAAASAALAGRPDVAKKYLEMMIQMDPTRRMSNVEESLGPYRWPKDLERYKKALRLAGLPD